MANVVLDLSLLTPSWTAAHEWALLDEVPTAADLGQALSTVEEVREAFPKYSGRASARRPRVSLESWQSAFSQASGNLFQISARMVADRGEPAEARKRGAAVLSRLVREETLPLKTALHFFWALFLYSDEPSIRLAAIQNFSSLFQTILRPFLLGNGRLEFPTTQKTWEERFTLRTIRALKLFAADTSEEKRMREEAQALLRRFREIIKPKGIWADRLRGRESQKFQGLNNNEFCLAVAGRSREELGALRADHRHRAILPLSIDQFHAICKQRQIWIRQWEARGAMDLKHESALLKRMEEAYQQRDRRKFFTLLSTLLGWIV